MTYQNEEGLPLAAEQETINKVKPFNKTLIALVVLASLALTGIGAYLSVSKVSNVAVTNLEKENFKLKKMISKEIVEDDFHPYAYLKGKFLTAKFRTVGHGLTEEGEIVKGERPFFSVDINFFGSISKTHYNSKDRTLEEKYLLGNMRGLDDEANILFTDGAYCDTEKIPSYGKIEILCGDSFKIIEIKQKSECNLRIKVTHPTQCQDKVGTIEQPKLMAETDNLPNLLVE
jgi:hypothetical protein